MKYRSLRIRQILSNSHRGDWCYGNAMGDKIESRSAKIMTVTVNQNSIVRYGCGWSRLSQAQTEFASPGSAYADACSPSQHQLPQCHMHLHRPYDEFFRYLKPVCKVANLCTSSDQHALNAAISLSKGIKSKMARCHARHSQRPMVSYGVLIV